MTDPYLIPCLVRLRSEFNTENPNRDKGADGWIGDKAHQSEVSDHNPDSKGRVLAVDIDSTGPWPGNLTLDDYVDFIVARCQSGEEDRIEYIIRNREIYERDNGYKARNYTGKDPHTNHAHFSARHDHTGQNDEGEWFMLSGTDKTWIQNTVTNIVQKQLDEFFQFVDPNDKDKTVRHTVSDIGLMEKRRAEMESRIEAAIAAKPSA